MALLATITLVNASDSKYPEDGSNIESRSPLQHQISLLSSENTALEIELEEAKSQITDLMEQIRGKRKAIKAWKTQQIIGIETNLYHGKTDVEKVLTRGEEDVDDTSLVLALSALDLTREDESTPRPMLAAGAPENFVDINEHQRLLELNNMFTSKVTQSEKIIEQLNTSLKVMLEDMESLGENIDRLQAHTTKEEKNAYIAHFAKTALGMKEADIARTLKESGLS